jgi:hypothetical protein
MRTATKIPSSASGPRSAFALSAPGRRRNVAGPGSHREGPAATDERLRAVWIWMAPIWTKLAAHKELQRLNAQGT